MRRFIFLICLILIGFSFSAYAQQSLPPINPAAVTGDIFIAGSPILQPVTTNLVTRFTLEGYTGSIQVNPNGTATAFQTLCSGETDIVMADRQISPQEADACSAAGRPPIAFRIATSAVVVAVSPQNTYATNISTAELQQVFSTALTWSEVRPDWPGEPINRYGPATTSNAFSLFSTVVFGGNDSSLVTAIGAQYLADQNAVLTQINSANNAIGFMEASFALANQSSYTGVIIDGVAPTNESISNNNYPLSRPLFLYSTSEVFANVPQAVSFMNYYLTNIQFEANSAGLFPPPANALEVARSRWLSASGQNVPVVQPTATTAVQVAPTELDAVSATATAVAQLVDDIQPTATPDAGSPDTGPTPVFDTPLQTILLQARLDLELVVQRLLGNERPVGWSGSLDIENPQLPLLVRLDLELVAAYYYGIDSRPENWFGAVSSTREAISRDIRHDLEVLAEDVFGDEFPADWAGGDPILSCDRATQALANLLERTGLYALTADPASPTYCMQVSTEISRFVEVNLLANNVSFGADGVSVPADVTIETTIAVAFYNTSASQRAGVIPVGTGITPIARSYLGFSNMTLIEGDGFLLFVEWQNTSLTQDEWRALPSVADLDITPACSADWCDIQG